MAAAMGGEWSLPIEGGADEVEVPLELSAAARVKDARTNTTSLAGVAPPLLGSRREDASLFHFDAEDPLVKLESQSAPHDGWHGEDMSLQIPIDGSRFEVSYCEDREAEAIEVEAGRQKTKLNTTDTTDETETSLSEGSSFEEGFNPSQYMRRVRRRRNTFIFCTFMTFAASAISLAILMAKQERLVTREAELASANQLDVSSLQGDYAIVEDLEEEQSRDEPRQNEEDDDTRNGGTDIIGRGVYEAETLGPSLMSSDGPSSHPSLVPSLEPSYLPTLDPTSR